MQTESGNQPTQVAIVYALVPGVDQQLVLDVCLSEDHEISAELSDAPAETGATVSDHRRVQPRMLRIRGLVSEASIVPIDLQMAFGRMGLNDTFQSRDALQSELEAAQAGLVVTRAADVFQQLEAVFKSPALVTVVTEFEAYSNMALVSLAVHRDPDTGRALDAAIGFREVLFATTQLVEVRQSASKGASGEKRLGAKPTPPATPQQEESVLSRLLR